MTTCPTRATSSCRGFFEAIGIGVALSCSAVAADEGRTWARHVVDAAKPWRSVFVAAVDLDQDGAKDIVTGAWWYRNPGDAGGRCVRDVIGAPLNNMAVAHDFDRDGDPDILGTRGEGSRANAELVWAQNDGAGRFVILDNVAAGDGDFLQGVATGRCSVDLEQVALSWHIEGRGIQVLTVPPDPVRQPWPLEQISTVSQDEALSAGDIDRDGRTDLLLGTMWLRNGAGGWQVVRLADKPMPDRNRLVDVNGDGRLDAVVGFQAISTRGDVVWYEQPLDARRTWLRRRIATIIGPMSLDVGDVDLDGDVDVVAGEHHLADPSAAKLYLFENLDGRGAEWRSQVVAVGDEHHDGAILTDIDDDGDLDIVSIGWSHGRVLLYENLLSGADR